MWQHDNVKNFILKHVSYLRNFSSYKSSRNQFQLFYSYLFVSEHMFQVGDALVTTDVSWS